MPRDAQRVAVVLQHRGGMPVQRIAREPAQRAKPSPDRTVIESPRVFPDGTPVSIACPPPPAGVIPFARPRVVAALAAADPNAISVTPLPKPAATLLGVVPRAAVMAAIAKARAGDGTNPHPVTATVATDDNAKTLAISRFAVFDKLGLAAPAKQNLAARLLVNGYRLLGFAILTLIVVVLVGYIATTFFYYLSSSWVMPTVVSASDDKVVALQSQLAGQQNQRDKLAGELDEAMRAIAAEQRFQLEFVKSIKSDLEGRQAALGRVRQLASAAASTRSQIRGANQAYAAASAQRMTREYGAGLIDRHSMLAGNYQLAQISTSTLSLAERQAEFETRAAELGSAAQSLDAILADHSTAALSYEVLKIKRDYDTSKLALAKAIESRDVLAASLARQDKIISGLKQSAYLRALDDRAVVALVPYGNLDGIKPGTTLYGCRVGMVMCHQVGTVLEVLPGEVTFKHPHRDTQLRGQMIELRLDDAGAGEDDVLFAGGAPLGF
jgi:hypothetical protein